VSLFLTIDNLHYSSMPTFKFGKNYLDFFGKNIYQMHPSIINNEGCGEKRKRKDRSRRASESRDEERDEEARKFKFRRRTLYITRAFIGTGEWSNMTYNRVILATGDFPLYDPVSESSCLPSPPFLRERIKGISNEVGGTTCNIEVASYRICARVRFSLRGSNKYAD